MMVMAFRDCLSSAARPPYPFFPFVYVDGLLDTRQVQLKVLWWDRTKHAFKFRLPKVPITLIDNVDISVLASSHAPGFP